MNLKHLVMAKRMGFEPQRGTGNAQLADPSTWQKRRRNTDYHVFLQLHPANQRPNSECVRQVGRYCLERSAGETGAVRQVRSSMVRRPSLSNPRATGPTSTTSLECWRP